MTHIKSFHSISSDGANFEKERRLLVTPDGNVINSWLNSFPA